MPVAIVVCFFIGIDSRDQFSQEVGTTFNYTLLQECWIFSPVLLLEGLLVYLSYAFQKLSMSLVEKMALSGLLVNLACENDVSLTSNEEKNVKHSLVMASLISITNGLRGVSGMLLLSIKVEVSSKDFSWRAGFHIHVNIPDKVVLLRHHVELHAHINSSCCIFCKPAGYAFLFILLFIDLKNF